MVDEQTYEAAKQLFASKPATLAPVMPIFIRNSKSFEGDEDLNRRVGELASAHGGIMVCSKVGHSSAEVMYNEVMNLAVKISVDNDIS